MIDKCESVAEAWKSVVADQEMLEAEKKKLAEAERMLEAMRDEVVKRMQAVEDVRRHLDIDAARLFECLKQDVGVKT